MNEMVDQVSAAPTSTQNVKPDVARCVAKFHPDIWGDRFLSCAHESNEIDDIMGEQVQKLKEEVKRKLIAPADDPSQTLNLIDLVQRLGVSYHFESEIHEALHQLLKSEYWFCKDNDDDLYMVSLRFRLLRQQGFNVSSDVFNKFWDGKGQFHEYLTNDLQGILSFYEAAHLRVQGEHVLEEALVFTTTYLESIASHLIPPLCAQVSHALRHPIRKGLPRVVSRHFISMYQDDPSHDKLLLNFAKLDFNVLQNLHQKELSVVSRWWKDLGVSTKLPFVRDRVVEGYVWILGVFFEPQYSLARKILAKVISISSIIDDIYDAYGTLEELVVFTNAIERWDIGCIDQLPEYMKLCCKALLEVYEEIERELTKQGRSYSLHYSKEGMKKLVQAYLVEAKWCNENYIPTVDEHRSISLVSCGYTMLIITSFLGMGDIVTKEAFDWASKNPRIVTAASIICRLMDDMAGHQFEQERGHVASSVECYMKQHGVSEQEACDEFNKQITSAWKDINEECLEPLIVPMPLLTRVLNFARVMDLLYKDGDEYTHVGKLMKSCIASLLIDPVPI